VVLTEEIEAGILRIATLHDRSFSAEMRQALREHIARHTRATGDQPDPENNSIAAAANGDGAKTIDADGHAKQY